MPHFIAVSHATTPKPLARVHADFGKQHQLHQKCHGQCGDDRPDLVCLSGKGGPKGQWWRWRTVAVRLTFSIAKFNEFTVQANAAGLPVLGLSGGLLVLLFALAPSASHAELVVAVAVFVAAPAIFVAAATAVIVFQDGRRGSSAGRQRRPTLCMVMVMIMMRQCLLLPLVEIAGVVERMSYPSVESRQRLL